MQVTLFTAAAVVSVNAAALYKLAFLQTLHGPVCTAPPVKGWLEGGGLALRRRHPANFANWGMLRFAYLCRSVGTSAACHRQLK